jgi:NADPH:quinone reductase-like Zn-dependent oxidoreductase
VLGATGSVGLVAVQTAKLLGAAACRRGRPRARRAWSARSSVGADATVRLDDAGDLVAAFEDAFGGEGPSYVFDPLWGAPAPRLAQAAVRGRGSSTSGSRQARPPSSRPAAVRFKSLSILGHTNFAVPADELADHYRRLVGHVTAGDIRFEVERVPLDVVAARGAARRRAPARSSSSCRRPPGDR